jgi:hypothetical protein
MKEIATPLFPFANNVLINIRVKEVPNPQSNI